MRPPSFVVAGEDAGVECTACDKEDDNDTGVEDRHRFLLLN